MKLLCWLCGAVRCGVWCLPEMSLNNIVPLPSALCPLVPENKCDEYFSTGAGVGRSLSPGAQTEWARTVGWTAVQSSGANSVRTDLPVRVVSSNVWVNYFCILYLLYLSLIFIIYFFNKYQDNYSWEMSYWYLMCWWYDYSIPSVPSAVRLLTKWKI